MDDIYDVVHFHKYGVVAIYDGELGRNQDTDGAQKYNVHGQLDP
jgi:hypothetical protein